MRWYVFIRPPNPLAVAVDDDTGDVDLKDDKRPAMPLCFAEMTFNPGELRAFTQPDAALAALIALRIKAIGAGAKRVWSEVIKYIHRPASPCIFPPIGRLWQKGAVASMVSSRDGRGQRGFRLLASRAGFVNTNRKYILRSSPNSTCTHGIFHVT
jgi:hypothetical protein